MAASHDFYNTDLLDRIPLDARVVLEVGCSTGALGGEYKRRNPRARYLGIDTDLKAAEIAATRLDQVAVGEVNIDPMPFGAVPVDCLVYGDVLEHLSDPWAVLRAQVAHLADDGTVLICVPNVEHWSFAERLMRGTWDYEEQGLFDNTHLRWFSHETMRRCLRDLHLVPVEILPRVFDRDGAEAFVRAMTPSLQALGIDTKDYLRRCAPLQYVWRVKRQPVEVLQIASTMLNPVGGVSDVRVVEPLRAMNTDPSVRTRIVNSFDPAALPDGTPKIFVFHRPLLAGERSLRWVRQLIAAGYVVVCEFDDHPDYIPVLMRPDVQNFRAVHAVQTSTAPLAQVLGRDNGEVVVFPNAVARLPDVVNYADPNRITLFFGGLNRDEDWPALMPALNAVIAIAGDRLAFEVVNDRGFFDALDTPHKRFTPLCDYATYQALLSHCEISLMPLLDTPFNRCKSDLKFLEAAALRVTALASPVVYADTIVDDSTGLVFHTPQELTQKLMRIIANPAYGRQLADAARSYVAGHRMLAYQVAPRVAWYHSLWARRAELQAALLARVPELSPDYVESESV